MKEIHGIADAQRLQYADGTSDTHSIMIIDGDKRIKVKIASQDYAAGLTPQQARWLSRQLTMAANRLEKEAKP